ncbi:MAG: hypothetical protein E7Z90_03075 [Cyanobacteria bacterium SIG29]|nr:hypothetical protein [Cyanobacteria bacterium SIG29]
MFIKNFLISLLIIFLSPIFAFADHEIKAQNNAYQHNNQGINYLKEKYYFGAIKEFQIAINLNPNSQASAVYYVNLGTTYEKIGYDELAKPCFEKAVSLNILCFDYYLKLAQNYKKLGLLDEKIALYHEKTDSPLNNVLLGLLYIQKGDNSLGITILDDFCDKEKNLLITKGVKKYIKEITKDL